MVHRASRGGDRAAGPGFFIFYDDVDYALRAGARVPIWAVLDAVLVRQSTSTSSTTCRGGRATTCTATSSSCTGATGRTRGPRQAVLIAMACGRSSPPRGRLDEVRNVAGRSETHGDTRVRRDARADHARGAAVAGSRDLDAGLARPDVPRLGGRRLRGGALVPPGVARRPRGPHVRRAGPVPDGRREHRTRTGRAVLRHLPGDERPSVLVDATGRRGVRLPEPRHRPCAPRSQRSGPPSARRTAGPGCASRVRPT